MNETQEAQERNRFLHCPACAAALQLSHQFLDPERGKTICLFKCEKCGERVWDE
jgi:transcription initiation factor IIE alpha subunit